LVTLATAVGRGLTPLEAYASIPFFTTNYVNRGETVLLPGSSGLFDTYSANDLLTRGNLIKAGLEDAGRHDINTYLAELPAADDPEAFTGPATDVFRFYNPDTGGHFYTASEWERDYVISQLEDFRYEGEAFDVTATEQTGVEVYRFYNTNTRAHFYTASESERMLVDDALPELTFEGIAFYAYADDGGGTNLPVHRFYDTATKTHFYTASESERQVVADTLVTFWYEGVAFYVGEPRQGAAQVASADILERADQLSLSQNRDALFL
jgi:hypothetical protein